MQLKEGQSGKRRYSLITQEAAKELAQRNIFNGKTISKLNGQLEGEKMRNMELEKEVSLWKNRVLERDQEWRGIVEKLTKEKNEMIEVTNWKSGIPGFVWDLHDEINEKIEKREEEVEKAINLKAKCSRQTMDRKLDSLRKEMVEKINQQKSLTMDNLSEIFREMQEVRNIAVDIDLQNKKLIGEVKELRVKNKILLEQRNIAIQENIVNGRKMRGVEKSLEKPKQSSRLLTESKRFKSETKTAAHSFTVSQEINVSKNSNRFFVESTFDSPRPKSSKKRESFQSKYSPSKQKSHISFQRSFKKDRTKNTDINEMIISTIKQKDTSPWMSPILKTKQQSSPSSNNFGCFIPEYSLDNFSIFKTVQKNEENQTFKIRPKRITIDLSDLKFD